MRDEEKEEKEEKVEESLMVVCVWVRRRVNQSSTELISCWLGDLFSLFSSFY